ncbi:hypothetical protein J2848_000040 [Azospirillum lipoferum]|uniref:Uncharacterized protein n=1 Tax=Azospirillum lipoferum TaxID=193 RepID=A0A5A9GRB4_AZOLI|nr:MULTISPECIES: hypothetical protein [Azospirillum]KAA0596930.1 hypothetical protein FZ942_07380 [Azospirillum lipoferum]MCP1608404.1 hypothetical protein [Azospirillum lipoferum]MDW5536274.1 hypothetical protein [Azospirillum sp. NL1]
MAATAWMGQALSRRAAQAVLREHRRANLRKRGWSRDIARLMLVASVLVLGVLAVEIGRKAVTILSHNSAQHSIESNGEITG